MHAKTNWKQRLTFWLSFLLILTSIAIAQTYSPKTDLLTPMGSTVPDVGVLVSADYTQVEKDQLRWQFEQLYPNAVYLGEATWTYNCHSFAWNTSESGPACWVGLSTVHAEDVYMTDGSYIQVPSADKGEKVSYQETANHSAIQTTSDEWYDSKWGSWVLARHARADCPYTPSDGVTYWARHSRTLQNATLSTGTDRRYASYGSFTISNVIVQSGVSVDIVSHGAMTIQSGFTIYNGAVVLIRQW